MKIFRVLRNEYMDSLYLMKLSSEISHWPGVHQAVIVMGTDSNQRILKQVGLDSDKVREATPNDLIIAVELDPDIDVSDFNAGLDRRLKKSDRSETQNFAYPSLDAALQSNPDIALVSISTPGEYAADQAREALLAGKHVFCFSHHIPVETEIELKDLAIKKDLLMMGPDCGTAVLDGIGLGFANQVRKGTIGVVSASGSGLQEVISLIHRAGGGISQAVGVGGRDLASPVDGRMAEAALKLIAAHPGTNVLILLAKKVSPAAQKRILAAAEQTGLPTVVQFHGSSPFQYQGKEIVPIWAVETYEECAGLGTILAGYPWKVPDVDQQARAWIKATAENLPASRQTIRGLFAGGSLCTEAAQILSDRGIPIETNLAGPVENWQGTHRLIDLGAEEYTQGRAHPFIDHRLRALEIGAAFADPTVAVLLLDVVLGWGCHEDPAGELVTVLKDARTPQGQGPVVIASVCGTDADPQGYDQQCKKLNAAGVYVAHSNAMAARLAREYICWISVQKRKPSEGDADKVEVFLKHSRTIVNLGLPLFEAGPRNRGAKVFPVHWRSSPKVSAAVKKILDDLM